MRVHVCVPAGAQAEARHLGPPSAEVTGVCHRAQLKREQEQGPLSSPEPQSQAQSEFCCIAICWICRKRPSTGGPLGPWLHPSGDTRLPLGSSGCQIGPVSPLTPRVGPAPLGGGSLTAGGLWPGVLVLGPEGARWQPGSDSFIGRRAAGGRQAIYSVEATAPRRDSYHKFT